MIDVIVGLILIVLGGKFMRHLLVKEYWERGNIFIDSRLGLGLFFCVMGILFVSGIADVTGFLETSWSALKSVFN